MRQKTKVTLFAGRPLTTETPAVLFAFDDWSVPRTRGIALEMVRPEKHPGNPLLKRGSSTEPDGKRAQSAAVLREGGRWRMWYSAHPEDADEPACRVAYAESDDGLHWRKPNLGLVEWNGDRDNNLVDAEPGLNTLAVMYDPDAPAERRYMMAGEDIRWWAGWSLDVPSLTRIDVSPDGLHWTSITGEPGVISQQNETMTIYRFDGKYHLGGHQISPLLRLPMQRHELGGYLGPRAFVVWRSSRLDRWPLEHTKAFFKPMGSSSPYRRGWDREEVHLGAVVTSYPNVCLGIYGQWHHPINDGAPQYHAEEVSADLGLIISNDGLHFREPAPGYSLIARDQELSWDSDFSANTDMKNLLLYQGSVVNTEDRTHVYYGASTPGGNVAEVCCNVGLATMPRDRFGCLRLTGTGAGQFVTCGLEIDGKARLFANADVPDDSALTFSLLDEDGLEELPGFRMSENGAGVGTGLDEPVIWPGSDALPANVRFRVRGELRSGAKLYALRIQPAE